MSDLGNLARNSLQAGRWRELVRKATHRVTEPGRRHEATQAAAWAQARSQPTEAAMVDPALRREAEAFHAQLEAEAPAILAAAGTTFGGGGHIALLYYLVRERRPEVVVETGVAAGWSSRAILQAMAANGSGHLWSSDLPYLRQRDSDQSIGCLVPTELREQWSLLVDGDHENVPAILAGCGPIDLFHYDSDKSKAGRRWALDKVWPHLAPTATFVMDDIGDNLFFADFVDRAPDPYQVFELQGKHIGLIERGGQLGGRR